MEVSFKILYINPTIINKGRSHTSKGIEKCSHLSTSRPINTPRPMLTKNCMARPAYRCNCLLPSSLFINSLIFMANQSLLFSIFFNLSMVVSNGTTFPFNIFSILSMYSCFFIRFCSIESAFIFSIPYSFPFCASP